MMEGLGACLATRSMECILCRRSFELLCGDLILSEYLFCDECLKELWPLDGEALREHISQRLRQDGQEKETAERVIYHIESLKQSGMSLEQIVWSRNAQLRAPEFSTPGGKK